MNDANFAFFARYVHEKAFIEVRFCIVLVCSEPQQVFKCMEYLKSLLYHHISKVFRTRLKKTRCNSLLPMCNDDVKSVKQHTRN